MSQPPFYVSPEQLMKDRADFARKGIGRGRSVVVMCFDQGVLFVAENPSRTLHKVSEIYDRIGFAAVGKYNEFENLRVAGIRYADMRGYSYDRSDVTARALANAYAQTLGAVFTQESKPYEIEIAVAEVGRSLEEDQIYRLAYDGSVSDEHGFVAMGGGRERIETALQQQWREATGLSDSLALAVRLLGEDPAGGAPRPLGPTQLEVAVLDRARPRRTFRRLQGPLLEQLLGGLPGSTQAAPAVGAPTDSPRDASTNPQTQRPQPRTDQPDAQDDSHEPGPQAGSGKEEP